MKLCYSCSGYQFLLQKAAQKLAMSILEQHQYLTNNKMISTANNYTLTLLFGFVTTLPRRTLSSMSSTTTRKPWSSIVTQGSFNSVFLCLSRMLVWLVGLHNYCSRTDYSYTLFLVANRRSEAQAPSHKEQSALHFCLVTTDRHFSLLRSVLFSVLHLCLVTTGRSFSLLRIVSFTSEYSCSSFVKGSAWFKTSQLEMTRH